MIIYLTFTMRIFIKFLCFFFLIPTSLLGQTIEEKLEKYHDSHHSEKIYISHDKPYYYVGDTIWGKVFFVDGRTHQSFQASPVVFVDWVLPGGEINCSINLKVKEGGATFDIPLAVQDSPGVYLLRAYTQYQRNFDPEYVFQKEIHIIGKNKEQEVQVNKKPINDFYLKFYPEGGHLVTGLASNLAFQALSETGETITLSGEIVDEFGNTITSLQTIHEGIGMVKFTPKLGKTYSAKISFNGINKMIPLPMPLSEGYILKINSLKKDYISIDLSSNSQNLLNGCKLIGHIRGQLFMSQSFGESNQKTLLLKKDQLPSGILHFTLFDHLERPVSERLIFNKNLTETVDIQINTQKTTYLPRMLVKGNTSIKLAKKVVPSSLSMSVFNSDLILDNLNGLTIENYLLFQSDLKGRINNIGQYFQADDLKTQIRLDLILLTHGWRKFRWQDVLDQKMPEFIYPIKENLAVIGRVTHGKTGENVKSDVSLNALSGEDFISFKLTTEEDGLFYFKGFQFEDTADIFIQGNIYNPKKEKKRKEGEMKRIGNTNVSIDILNFNTWELPSNLALKNAPLKPDSAGNQVEQLEKFRKIDSAYQALFEITLDEVSIEAKRSVRERNRYLKEKYKEKDIFYFSTTYKILMDDLPNKGEDYPTIFELVNMMVPMTTVSGPVGNRTIRFRKNGNVSGPALIIIDGRPVPPGTAFRLDPAQIEIIDVLQGLYATAYDAANVISILTREPGTYELASLATKPKGVINYQHPGYYQARAFYNPDYSKSKTSHQKPDFRTTLYWNPNLKIKNSAEEFEFYTGDLEGKYLIKIEGITKTGIPFVRTKEIEVIR